MNAPASIAVPAREARLSPGKYKLNRRDYLVLDEAGSFAKQETELVDGNVIVMSPEWIPHMRIKDELAYRLRQAIEAGNLGHVVGTGGSVDLSDVDQPRPDVVVMREFQGDRAIQPQAVLLVIEVSSSTLSFDIGDKAGVYASHGIAEYWVVDVNERSIRQMWSPQGEYGEHRDVPFGATIASVTIPTLTIDTSTL